MNFIEPNIIIIVTIIIGVLLSLTLTQHIIATNRRKRALVRGTHNIQKREQRLKECDNQMWIRYWESATEREIKANQEDVWNQSYDTKYWHREDAKR